MNKQMAASEMALTIGDARADTRRKSNGCVGIFSQFFDWNRRFAKKKLLPRASSKHGEFLGRDDGMAKKKLFKAEEGEVKKNGMKAAGLVVRLMGLENLPISKKLEGGDLNLVKARSERRRKEESQIKSVVSSYKKYRHHHLHKLSSPKSPRLVSSKNASKPSKLFDVASKILEPSNRGKPALSYDLTGQLAAKNSQSVKREAARVHWKGIDQGIVRESVQLNKSEGRERKSKVENRRRQCPPSVSVTNANQQTSNLTKFGSKADLKEAALGKYLEKKIRELGFCEDEKLSFNGAMRKKSIAAIFHELINTLNAEQSPSPSKKDQSLEGHGTEERYSMNNLKHGNIINDTPLKDCTSEKLYMLQEKKDFSRGRLPRRQLSFVEDVINDVQMVHRRPKAIDEIDTLVKAILPYISGLGFGERANGMLRMFAFDCMVEVFDMKYGSQSWGIVPSKGDVLVKEVVEEVSLWEAKYEKGHFYDVCEKLTNLDIGEEIGNQIMLMLVQEITLDV